MLKFQTVLNQLQRYANEKEINGAYVIIREKDQVMLSAGVGFQDETKEKAVTEKTIFRLALISRI
ncbi:CubicO group peptidase (beta-lactamase class C family) [Lachnospiraceae bacterium PF1-22]|uniref:hypothetical protein n=1 Tax=Ohessyouella blattaphilus TaxID=2949333 RepID=UPI003E18BF3C